MKYILGIFFICILIFSLVTVFLRPKDITPPLPIQPTVTPVPLQTAITPASEGKGRGFETEEFLQEEKEFLENTPILQKLPAGSKFFSIEYINEKHLIVHAKTADVERDYEQAKAWFTTNNIDTSSMLIEYN